VSEGGGSYANDAMQIQSSIHPRHPCRRNVPKHSDASSMLDGGKPAAKNDTECNHELDFAARTSKTPTITSLTPRFP